MNRQLFARLVKRHLCVLLIIVLLVPTVPIPQAKAAQDAAEKPIWTVAWVTVLNTPQKNLDGSIEMFEETADLFKAFIEKSTNYSVEIQITHMTLKRSMPGTVSFNFIDTKTKKDMGLNDYDTVMFGIDGRGVYSGWYNPGTTECNVSLDDIDLSGVDELNPYEDRLEEFFSMCVHEFLHQMEYWYRDKLRYSLPYDVYYCFDGSKSDDFYALHNFCYYDYPFGSGFLPCYYGSFGQGICPYHNDDYLIDKMEKDELDFVANDFVWYDAWFSNSVRNPGYPGNGKPEFLGIPHEAWQYTPTNGRRPTDPKVISGTISLTDSDAPHINLANETIALGSFFVGAYSVDGGKKWKTGALPTDPAKVSKLFNKALTLWVAEGYDKKAKKPTGSVIQFEKINARPKTNLEKLKPYYTSDSWELRKKNGSTATSIYEWAETTNKKTPSSEWLSIPEDGFTILYGKTKTTYLFRTPAKADNGTYTPASKIFKLTPSNYGKAPNYKVKTDKKTSKKTIKLKANDWYQVGDADPVKVTATSDLDVAEMTGTLTIWKGETGKKPRSEKQTLELISSVSPAS